MQKKLAIGIGMGFVALELAMLVAPAATRPAVWPAMPPQQSSV